jgi:hypothetical protein
VEIFYHEVTAIEDQDLLIVEDSWSHSVRHTTLCRTPLDKWPAQCRDHYLTTNNTHNRQTSILPLEFEHTSPESERPQTHALDSAATGIRHRSMLVRYINGFQILELFYV